jgi:putative redox protein
MIAAMSAPGFEVEVRSAGGDATALGNAGPSTLVVDRPADAGGRGLGFNGGQLLHLAVAGCISNDLFREARKQEITLSRVRVVVRGDFSGEPAVSAGISYEVQLSANAPSEQLEALVAAVDAIAEIPNSLRQGTPVTLSSVSVVTG